MDKTREMQLLRRLGELALDGKFCELENNLWEEGLSGNPLSKSLQILEHYVEVMLLSIGELALEYEDYDDFYEHLDSEEKIYAKAQPIFNKWAHELYPDEPLIDGVTWEKEEVEVLRVKDLRFKKNRDKIYKPKN